ncbi:hypothetical protein D3C71_1677280 [compost metagenome]
MASCAGLARMQAFDVAFKQVFNGRLFRLLLPYHLRVFLGRQHLADFLAEYLAGLAQLQVGIAADAH